MTVYEPIPEPPGPLWTRDEDSTGRCARGRGQAVTAAEVLRRAAERIEQLAASTTGGPWQIEYNSAGHTPQALFVECPEDHLDGHDGTRPIGGFDEPADNVWASAMGPQVAGPLAAAYEDYPLDVSDDDASLPVRLARAVLGETAEETL
jgi:hypothetical protein